jgi:hypothetical protein
VVTGPASFNPDGSAFAVYAQVGSRRRLIVAQLKNLGTDRVEVVALVAPPAPSGTPGSAGPSVSGAGTVGASSPATGSSSPSASKSASSSAPAREPDGFPIPAPLTPLWWNGQVVGLGSDATVVGYQPGSGKASLLDLGTDDLQAMAALP